MLLGTFEHNLDDKLRLTIPSKLRTKLGEKIYVSRGFEGSLEIREEKEFITWSKQIMDFSNLSSNARLLRRMILSNSSELEIDSAGRIKIPNDLLQKAEIKKSVYIIGVGDRIEIWDKEKYESYVSQSDESFEAIADQLGNLGDQ